MTERIKLTEEIIHLIEVPTKGHALEPYTYHLRIDFSYDKKEAQQVKDKILDDYEKLEKIQKELDNKYHYGVAESIRKILKDNP